MPPVRDIFEGADHVNATTAPVADQAQPRRRGAKKGRPKPLGSGRRKGVRNGAQKSVEELLRPLVPACRRRLKQLINDPKSSPDIVLRAVREIHAYCFGKPIERVQTAGTLDVRAQSVVHHAAQDALLQGIGHAVRTAHALGQPIDERLIAYLPELVEGNEELAQ